MAAWNWYTRGRRIPTLIGKDAAGHRIPGGPYTALQAVSAVATPGLLWFTRGIWAADLFGLATIAVIVGATVGAVKLFGKVDFASRNPLLILGSYLRQTAAPIGGTLGGKRLVEPKPHPLIFSADTAQIAIPQVTLEAILVDEPLPADALSTTSETIASVPSSPAEPSVVVNPASAPPPSRKVSGKVAASLQPAAAVAPDRRRSGLEAFLASAAASTEENAA